MKPNINEQCLGLLEAGGGLTRNESTRPVRPNLVQSGLPGAQETSLHNFAFLILPHRHSFLQLLSHFLSFVNFAYQISLLFVAKVIDNEA
ncbi:unnamed protein product [Microthlaspi erraticum]|uniref:Uncharacterized protein n=1 Tax=Microthlaspi erraticum TaxID=1685480 RepID=A0A6D2LBL7_9BRAS|nr:unnamed protein product [Microthlaspi erraticum]